MAHLSPSAIFSPSVARQQLATAKDWNYIDGWLTTKFNGKSAPPFERNNDTLKALLALAALNETADEDCELISKVEAKSLQELQRKEATDADGEFLKALEDHLTREGHTSLDALSSAGVALKQPFGETERLAQKIVDLQITSFNLEQASDRVAILHGHLTKELEQITALVEELGGDAYRPSSELPKQTLEYQRKTKVLAAKLPDLKNRIASLTAATGGSEPTIEDVKVEENKFKELVATVKELEAQVKSYHGLPHDTDLARLEVEGLRVELKKLTRQRDSMFEGLVERESPKKSRSSK
jgi:HAUS augmin-like complex subunit 1